MKKLICVVLAITICFSMVAFSAGASASSESMVNSKITEALNAVEYIKEQLGLTSVDFEELKYSNSIYAYDYTKEGIKYNSEFIPIIYEDALIGWVIKAAVDSNTIYQFSNAFTSQVNSIINRNTNFAFVYERDSSYLYDGAQLFKLGDISMVTEDRTSLGEVSVLRSSNITLNNIATRYDLHYTTPTTNSRTPTYYECSVPFVSQNPPSNICWAASIASILNFLNDTNLTAVSVAKKWYNATSYADYNKALTLGSQDDVLKTYGISYTYKSKVPSDGVILKNIRSGYPISATFKWTSGYHDVVIYGINLTGGHIYVMDPEYGFCGTTYSTSSGHTYVSGYSGVTLTLNRATCKYWTS